MTRLTSIALIPLTLWFIFSVIGLAGEPRAAVVAWLSAPFPMALMILLVLATFHHLQLGLQVVIEDYVHQDAAKLAAVLAVKAACALLGLACIVAVLKIGL